MRETGDKIAKNGRISRVIISRVEGPARTIRVERQQRSERLAALSWSEPVTSLLSSTLRCTGSLWLRGCSFFFLFYHSSGGENPRLCLRERFLLCLYATIQLTRKTPHLSAPPITAPSPCTTIAKTLLCLRKWKISFSFIHPTSPNVISFFGKFALYVWIFIQLLVIIRNCLNVLKN